MFLQYALRLVYVAIGVGVAAFMGEQLLYSLLKILLICKVYRRTMTISVSQMEYVGQEQQRGKHHA